MAIPCTAPGVRGSVLGLAGPGVGVLQPGDMESSICTFSLTVSACTIGGRGGGGLKPQPFIEK